MRSVDIAGVAKPEGRLDGAQLLGSGDAMMFVYDLEPGRSSSPYHHEYAEEWLLVVDGTRVPAGSVYPDSDKLGVWSAHEPDELIFKRGIAVPWSEGEDGCHLAS